MTESSGSERENRVVKYFCDGCGVSMPEEAVWGDEGALADSESVVIGTQKHEVQISIYVAHGALLCGKCAREAIEKIVTRKYGKPAGGRVR